MKTILSLFLAFSSMHASAQTSQNVFEKQPVYMVCAGTFYMHYIVVNPAKSGVVYRMRKYTGALMNEVPVSRHWSAPFTFRGNSKNGELILRVTDQPVKSARAPKALEAKSIQLTHGGRAVDVIRYCMIDPSVGWAELE